MKIDANYTSSGVLLVLPASGGGFFHADLGQLQTFIIRTQLGTKKEIIVKYQTTFYTVFGMTLI